MCVAKVQASGNVIERGVKYDIFPTELVLEKYKPAKTFECERRTICLHRRKSSKLYS